MRSEFRKYDDENTCTLLGRRTKPLAVVTSYSLTCTFVNYIYATTSLVWHHKWACPLSYLQYSKRLIYESNREPFIFIPSTIHDIDVIINHSEKRELHLSWERCNSHLIYGERHHQTSRYPTSPFYYTKYVTHIGEKNDGYKVYIGSYCSFISSLFHSIVLWWCFELCHQLLLRLNHSSLGNFS